MPKARPTEADYPGWARETIGTDFESKGTSAVYGVNVAAAMNAVYESQFWNKLDERLEGLSDAYKKDHDAELFIGSPTHDLLKKPYESVVDKTFRQNVLWNRKWPEPPEGGWITGENIYSKLDDLLRTTVVCGFLDGPGVVTEALDSFAKELGLTTEIRQLSRDEGYYAHHFYLAFPIEFVSGGGGVAQHSLRVEVQVTTQTQNLLRHLTHPYYKQQRSKPFDKKDNWQWSYKTNRFRARYLSHALHLLEAMILEVRDNPDKKDGKEGSSPVT